MYIIRVKNHLASNAIIEGWITSDYDLCDRIKDAKWFTEVIAAHEFIKILKTKWKYNPKYNDIQFLIYEPDGNDLLNDLLEDEPDHELYEEAKTAELLERCEKLGEQLERMDDLITEIRHNLEAAKSRPVYLLRKDDRSGGSLVENKTRILYLFSLSLLGRYRKILPGEKEGKQWTI